MKNQTEVKFIIYTFIITYFFWGLAGILSSFGLYVHPSYNIGIVFYIIAVCSPAISTYILLQKNQNQKGIKNFLQLAFKPNRIILSVILIGLFCLIRFGIPLIYGDVTVVGNWWQVLLYTPVMMLFGGLEEIGWRGYLQTKLTKRFGFFITTSVILVVWILWHIPLCWIQGTYQYSNSYLWFIITLIGSSFSLSAIREITGSVLACIVLHSFGNAVLSYGIVIESGTSLILSNLFQVIVAIIAVGIYRKSKNYVSN